MAGEIPFSVFGGGRVHFVEPIDDEDDMNKVLLGAMVVVWGACGSDKADGRSDEGAGLTCSARVVM